MKRPLLISLCLLLAFIVANAQQSRYIVPSFGSDIEHIPAKFSKSGNTRVIFSNYSKEKQANELSILDPDLTESQKDIVLSVKYGKHTTEYERTEYLYNPIHTYSYPMRDTTMTRINITVKEGSVTTVKKSDITEEDVRNHFIPTAPKNSYTYIYSGFGTRPYTTREEHSLNYKMFEVEWLGKFFHGYTYPGKETFSFSLTRPESTSQVSANVTADMAWGYLLTPNGEFYKVIFNNEKISIQDKRTYFSSSTSQVEYLSSPIKLNYMDWVNENTYSFRYSETLFNDDSDIEYICCEYGDPITETSGSATASSGLVTETRYPLTNRLLICNSSGATINTIGLPDGYRLSTIDEVSVMDFGSKRYLAVKATSPDNSVVQVLYDITGGASSVSSPVATVKADVTPTFMTAGTDVTVTLPQGHGGSLVAVVSTNGTLMSTQNVQPGEGTAIVATDGFPSGMYIVTITDATNASREACKS